MKARSFLRLPAIRPSSPHPQASRPASIVVVNVRDLARQTSKLVDDVQSNGLAVLITRHGVPVATLTPIDEDDLEQFTRANAAQLSNLRSAGDARTDESSQPGGELAATELHDAEQAEAPRRPEQQPQPKDERPAEDVPSSMLGAIVARARRVTRTSR